MGAGFQSDQVTLHSKVGRKIGRYLQNSRRESEYCRLEWWRYFRKDYGQSTSSTSATNQINETINTL